ncbi:uncharacterized protein GIQ15_05590 [Arthroderma uncinatum]|uniref:uncharacterized protein n=1 Tax=Arthroderma uncinatum TaxID=74035 RepID=UPI00144AB253|nr:uncharacterized protein GIQ15_05590 [Arthroderma uncinatum]KAF3480243.1 hypothetical protein GIQ15_05590 [Arthroderma uncinatum]
MEPPSTTFAKVIPSNTAAKLAFHAVYEATMDEDAPQLHRQNIYVHPEQQYDKDALLSYLEEQKIQGDTDSDSLTDPDTDTENTEKLHAMIWTGWFSFSLDPGPHDPVTGWTIGKGGRRRVNIDYLLPWISAGVRGYHARFNLHEKTGYLFVSKTSSAPHAEVVVNGKSVGSGEQFSLNQNPMNIRISNLEFEFQYTNFAYADQFYRRRQTYMRANLNTISFPNSSITPTPISTFRCFGPWTISSSLGRGAYGRVSSATNSKGEVVAIKIIERSERTAHQVSHEVRILNELQKLPEVHEGDRERVVRLKEAIYQNGDEVYTSAVFDEVALVLEPAVSATFAHITSPAAGNKLNYSLQDLTRLFHDALLGLNFLHSHDWIHGDLKPSNIGILDVGFLHVVLLDFGGAVNLPPGYILQPTPGRSGTVNYLAPERELVAYDHSIDVWAMGVIGFQLLHGHHPWKFAVNPWRRENQFASLRPTFHDKYRKAVHRMKSHVSTEFNEMLLQMLRHPWAVEGNNGERIAVRDALKSACWQDLEGDQPFVKRTMAAPQEQAGSHVFKSWLDAAAVIDEKMHGPLPDVVSTQGHHLRPRPNSPIFERKHDPEFLEKLDFFLDDLLFLQKLRRRKYGNEVADEWPPSHTPTEIKDRWKTEQEEEQRKIKALLDIPTPPTPADVQVWTIPRMASKRRRPADSAYSSGPPTPVLSRKRRKHIRPKESASTEISPISSKTLPRDGPSFRTPPSLHSASPESLGDVT